MGGRFYVKPPRLRDASAEIHQYSRQVVQVSSEILDVARSLGGMSGMAGVCSALRRISEDARSEASLLAGISDAAVRVSAFYDKTENNILTNGEKSRQKFPVHKVAVWNNAGLWKIPSEIRILR